jgi:hypothetical protein
VLVLVQDDDFFVSAQEIFGADGARLVKGRRQVPGLFVGRRLRVMGHGARRDGDAEVLRILLLLSLDINKQPAKIPL